MNTLRRCERGKHPVAKQRLVMTRCATGLAALALAGCATIGLDPPRNEDTPREVRAAPKPEPKPFPTITQNGPLVGIRIAESCMTRHWRDYDRVTVEERRNQSKGLTWFKTIAGVGLIGGGVPVLVDAHSVGSSSGNTATYNPVGQGGAYAMGAGLVAVGALSLGSAIYDLARVHGAQRTPSHVELEETFTGPLACEGPPAHGFVRVVLGMGGQAGHAADEIVDLGTLGLTGAARFDLATAIPSGKLVAGTGASSGRLVFASDGSSGIPKGDYAVGDVDLKPARAQHATKAWAALDKETCRHAQATNACNHIIAFGNAYPVSAEKAQADALLVEAKPALDIAADNEAWTAVNSSDCTTPKTETACDTTEAYLTQRPNGLHAAEAKRILVPGQQRVARLRAAREAQEAAEAARAAAKERAKAARHEECIRACMQTAKTCSDDFSSWCYRSRSECESLSGAVCGD